MKSSAVTLGLLLRHLLGAFGGYLVGRDVLTADQAASLTEVLVEAAGGIGMLAISIAWSWLQKRGNVPA